MTTFPTAFFVTGPESGKAGSRSLADCVAEARAAFSRRFHAEPTHLFLGAQPASDAAEFGLIVVIDKRYAPCGGVGVGVLQTGA